MEILKNELCKETCEAHFFMKKTAILLVKVGFLV